MSSHNSVTLCQDSGQPVARPGTQAVRTISVQRDMPVARFDLNVLDSRGAWYWTMARHSRGAAKAVYSARAELANAYWDRARRAA